MKLAGHVTIYDIDWVEGPPEHGTPVYIASDERLCDTCINRGRTNGLSQESFCSSCIHQEYWRKDHYVPVSTNTLPQLPRV